jgi:hypothetical protein
LHVPIKSSLAWSALAGLVALSWFAACSTDHDASGDASADAATDTADATTGDSGDTADGGPPRGSLDGGSADAGDASLEGGPMVCHPATPPDDGGWSPPDAGAATTCRTAGDCAATQGCVAGMCASCTQDSDCGEQETCGAGGCTPTCGKVTLQQIVDTTPADASVTIPACTFRESVSLKQPIALIARPGAEIRGSDVWMSWADAGAGTWTNAARLATPVVANDVCHCDQCYGQCTTSQPCTTPDECACAQTANCYLPQQVFVDDVPLTQVTSAKLAAGEFAVDMSTGAITIATAADPNGSRVEVTTRSSWVTASRSLQNVTIQGFTMRHAASQPQKGALDTTGGKCHVAGGWLVKNNRLLYAAGGALTPNAYDQILGNEIGWNGQEGANSTCFDHGLMQGNYIHDNNTESFAAGWEAAGVKGTQTVGAVYDANVVTNNAHGAAGLWADINTFDTTYTNNYVAGNDGSGIQYEISDTARIECNVLKDNGPSISGCDGGCPRGFFGAAQILVSASPNVGVAQNTVSGAMGIGILQQYRDDSCGAGCPASRPDCCSSGVCSGSSVYHQINNVVVADNDVTETQPGTSGGLVAGLAMDVCVAGRCAGSSPGFDAGGACDGGVFYQPSVLTFRGNTYHAASCTLTDWDWIGGNLPFATWAADMDAGAESCGSP